MLIPQNQYYFSFGECFARCMRPVKCINNRNLSNKFPFFRMPLSAQNTKYKLSAPETDNSLLNKTTGSAADWQRSRLSVYEDSWNFVLHGPTSFRLFPGQFIRFPDSHLRKNVADPRLKCGVTPFLRGRHHKFQTLSTFLSVFHFPPK